MVKANAGLQIDQKITDCGTKRTFDLLITKDLADLVLQRNYVNQNGNIKQIETADQVLDKKLN